MRQPPTFDEAIEFIEAIFGGFGPDAGVPLDDIAAAERGLGMALPYAIRELYARTGRAKPLHAAHNTLVPVDRLGFGGDHLIFYEENQAVVAWGIARSRLSESDPPVDQGQTDADDDAWSFYPEFVSVSEFACAQAAWQAVQGGLPFIGVLRQQKNTKAARESRVVNGPEALVTVSMRAWLVEGGVAVDAGDGYFGLATRDVRQFRAAAAQLGIEPQAWDHATIRDDA